MRMIPSALAIGFLLVVAACASPQEQAAREAAQRQSDEAECQKIGFTPGSEAFANCLLKLREIRAQEANTRELRRAQTPSPWWGGPYPGYYPYPYPYPYRRW
ncbi:hypothetical protein Plav_2528 [Parvibaculum lavamentivorans DS-1]|uniref:Lipoprotein n=1 Tax=Parvibaculum lavamentivorans (strain DS-1 / DSM 13023 / NCIMB 13966) TaxID=402881 RepID=A7HW54_PARL1|nr:hypothetical protein [Parvibaculum lavamentivorans]ABS64137.1 hypothetical protein Plav_2528 [Parvibaculum lavamentivorans DS-1]